MAHRDITMDDMKDVKLPVGATLFEALVATAVRAKEIYKEEEKALKTRPKRSRERITAAVPKRQNPIPPNIINNGRQGEEPQPPLPPEFKNVIEEMARRRNAPPPAERLLIQKKLFQTDTSKGNNRLSIPIRQIEDNFLTGEEKQRLADYDGKKKKFLEVTLLEPSREPASVKLSRWDMSKQNGGKMSSIYVINGKWNDIVARNRLKEGTVVQLWCFRIHEDLCFALVRL